MPARVLPFAQDFGATPQHDPAEPCPILIVTVDDHRDRRVLCNIPQPLQGRLESRFGFSSIVM